MSKLTTLADLSHYSFGAVVLAHGCWDGLHAGHLHHLRDAKAQGDVLVVSVTTDAWIDKGPGRPYMPEVQRAELMDALEIVDYVILTAAPSAAGVIAALKPAVFAKGADYADYHDRHTLEEAAAVKLVGGRMHFTSDAVRYASTVVFAHPA